ncbi:MAG: hypothetical protein PHE49_11525, partial [bacterium]|nr:hypothetical protein [bacterium]
PICPLLKTNAKAFSTLSTVAKQILKTIIRPSWTLIADEEKYMSGYHMFISVNLKRIPSGLENILLTIGNLTPPEIHNDILKKDNTLEIKTKNSPPDYELGILTINPQTLQINHYNPKDIPNKTIPIPIPTPDSLVFIYYKQDKNFSPSVRIQIPQ